jgi:hypothetical protein
VRARPSVTAAWTDLESLLALSYGIVTGENPDTPT